MTQSNNQMGSDQSSADFVASSPKIELPKGGGAIRGIGEKFAANPVTGTGSMSVPIVTSPGRSGFGPQLSISYDSGAGNGPFGFGWNLSIPAITRKTDKGLPQYRDADESDVFILSGSEDLVPMLKQQSGTWESDTVADRVINATTYKIRRYRPRIEGLFARIERWNNIDDPSDVHWRSISKDNILTLYGNDADSRIFDPEDSSRIFSWLISETRDDKGNAVLYRYKAEDGTGVDLTQVNERNRGDSNAPSRTANRYLKRIYYGNRTSLLNNAGERPHFLNKPQIETQIANHQWMFEAVFDYGEHDPDVPRPNDAGPWEYRSDPFSSYRSGFEVRTSRLCQRVLMFHHFDGETGVGNDCLVRSTDFTYSADQNRIYTFLNAVTQAGYKRKNAGYDKRDMPPVEYEYTQPVVQEEVHNVDPESLQNLPIGVDGSTYQWTDLHGEGIPGILTEQAGSWLYKGNLSPASKLAVEFSPLESVTSKPNLSLEDNAQFMDLDGDGRPDLVVMEGLVPGLYEHDQEEGWDSFRPFTSHFNRDMGDPNLKFIDLDGDGHADVMITEDDAFIWHASLAEQGFAPAKRVARVLDEEHGPRLVFADGTQSIYLSDMSGDGLTDLVRIRNGEVCYWPNLGYCHFGAKITMDGAPHFDNPDQFDHKRIRLADIDGSGTTDIIYLHREGVRLYFNQSGNSWSDPQILQSFPHIDDMVSIATTDLLGNGTACLVWSSTLPGNAQCQMRYVNLMGEHKPHLLFKTVNNLGAETRVQYVPSTQFYLQDKRAGKPWLTKLPFPVHVVERVETFDHISRNHFVTCYAYHHGYFDGVEREFRGFAMVEQWDTEQFAELGNSDTFPFPFPLGDNVNAESHVPPVHTKTWFHTGVYLDRQTISQHYTNEYYSADPEAVLLPDTVLQSSLSTQEQREACRALKGSILRQEVYALDESPQSPHPYSVSEQNYELKQLQPVESNRHAVFFAHARQSLDYHYERNPADPRISHVLTLAVDDFGNVTQSAAIVYPRRTPAYDEQARLLCTYSQNDFIHHADVETFYRIGVPYQSRSYEITGLDLNSAIFSLQDIRTAIDNATEINYEQQVTQGVLQKRLIETEQMVYYRNDLSGPLPVGEVESLALHYESYLMAFTPELLQQVYDKKIEYTELSDILKLKGGFVLRDGVWWDPSGYQEFDPAAFYLPTKSIDPFDNIFTAIYDAYALLITGTEDPLHNIETADNNYRVLQPWMETDINQNQSAVKFDELGMIIATAEMGKEGLNEGDTLADPTTMLEYELFNWMQNQKPNFVHTLAREQHQDSNTRWQESYAYSDGLGHEISSKVQAEPGIAPARDNEDHLLHEADGTLIFADTLTNVRWVGTGRKVFDNKGNPVKQYEPFFSNSHQYEDETELVEWGVTPILHYDPLGRMMRTVNPNGTFSKVEFDSWQQRSFDENDTVTDSDWYAVRINLPPSDPQHRAAELSSQHNNTPAIAHLDTLGRSFLTISDNGSDGQYSTHIELDIEGNPRVITDARGNPVMQYAYNMIGPADEDEEEEEESEEDKPDDHLIYQNSMDGGERWMLYNVVGNPIRSWDSRNYVFSYEYDALQRQTNFYVQTENASEFLAEQIVYGDSIINPDPSLDPVALNLRGQVYQQYDGAGVVTNVRFDFKDNLLESNRQLVTDYSKIPDWSQSIGLEDEIFITLTDYDALNRPDAITTPDKSIYRPTYNEANLLEAVNVNLHGSATQTAFVTNINYDAKGQREEIEYANGVATNYKYDPLTFRLIGLNTFGTLNNTTLQELTYTYDPVGNIMEIYDNAQQKNYYKNDEVEPHNRYEYDALYRLIKADGREHAGQEASNQRDQKDFNHMNVPNTNDGQAMRNYCEEFNYDEVGNIMSMVHRLGRLSNLNPGQEVWKRRYQYATSSNRLLSTSRKGDADVPVYFDVNSDTEKYSDVYDYDDHGNMTSMPHLTLMQWDYDDQLKATSKQVVNNGNEPETTWYTYDAGGQRVRKVTEHQAVGNETPTRMKERIYLDGFEIYRDYKSDGTSIKLERETLHIMDDEQRVAMVETKVPDENSASPTPTSITRYQINNYLGSSSLELDEINGSIISYEEYYPYGNTSYHAAKSGVEVSQKRYRYTGKEKDDETGLYYHGARYYASWLGRWTKIDAGGSGNEVNLYCYTLNNPTSLVDPDGRAPKVPMKPLRMRSVSTAFPVTPVEKYTLKLDHSPLKPPSLDLRVNPHKISKHPLLPTNQQLRVQLRAQSPNFLLNVKKPLSFSQRFFKHFRTSRNVFQYKHHRTATLRDPVAPTDPTREELVKHISKTGSQSTKVVKSTDKILGAVAKAIGPTIYSFAKKESVKITTAIKKIEDAFKSLGRKIVAGFKAIAGAFKWLGRKIVAGLKAIAGAFKRLGEKIVSDIKAIPSSFKWLGSKIKEWYRVWKKANSPGQSMPFP